MSVPDIRRDGARPPGRRYRRFLPRKRTWRVLAAAAAAVLAVGIAVPAMAVLTGSPSKFEANDGNMTVDTAGNSDWNSVQGSPNYVHLTDPANTTSDDSFKSGQKQDTPCPVIDTNKNPPKDDFTDVASFNETNLDPASPQFRHTFLDGATIRFTANGNASENVELNQGTNGSCGTDPVTGVTLLKRAKGDKLIAIDYLNGGTNVQFHVLTWIIDSSDTNNATCLVKTDSPPCWGVNVVSLAASAAEGQVNQSPIAAADNLINNTALVTGQFAEFGVDLTAAGIIPANTCEAFPQSVWESRASGSSFVSSTEDISLEHHTISNCGTIHVVKETVPAGSSTSFSYSTTGGLNPASFSLTGQAGSNEQTYSSLLPGTYTVTEGTTSGWTLTALACTPGGTADLSTATASYTVAPGSDITCTFTNTQQLGAIEIIKDSSKSSAAPLAGATFSITGPNGYSNSVTTGADGTACVENLVFGDYTITETAAPAGYAIDNAAPVTATVGTTGTCSSPSVSETFTDTPLTDLSVTATSEAPGGTVSTITCLDSSNTNIGDSPKTGGTATVTANGLHPGTYTCTVVIDP